MTNRKSFVYGVPVTDYNFAGRSQELARLKADFEHGINVILMSPRRMGKTSLVKKACREIQDSNILFVYLDIFGCKNEYEFLNKFAEAVLKQTASQETLWWEETKEFLYRLTPKITFSSDPTQEMSVSLGITPKTHSPEDVLSLAETIAERKGKRVVVCIDEFQQIGEMPDSAQIQARMRSLWQHQSHVSYCLFGSKHHLMGSIFLNKSMPFYQFGDLIAIDKIDDRSWSDYIVSHFTDAGRTISSEFALDICHRVESYSAYVQQLSWLVCLSVADGGEVTNTHIDAAFNDLLSNNEILFMQQIEPLSAYQMNMIRAITSGEHSNFTKSAIRERFSLGSYSNVTRLRTALLDRDIIEQRLDGIYLTDPVFAEWFRRKLL